MPDIEVTLGPPLPEIVVVVEPELAPVQVTVVETGPVQVTVGSEPAPVEVITDLAALPGPPGAPGLDGTNGAPGAPGADGVGIPEVYDSTSVPAGTPDTYLRFVRDAAGDVQQIILGTVT